MRERRERYYLPGFGQAQQRGIHLAEPVVHGSQRVKSLFHS